MALILARAGKELNTFGRCYFNLMLKSVSRLLFVVPPCFASADVQLNNAIGDFLCKSGFFARKHRLASLKK
jgi:hypothetical protein